MQRCIRKCESVELPPKHWSKFSQSDLSHFVFVACRFCRAKCFRIRAHYVCLNFRVCWISIARQTEPGTECYDNQRLKANCVLLENMTAWNGQQREWLADFDHDDDGDDAVADTERILSFTHTQALHDRNAECRHAWLHAAETGKIKKGREKRKNGGAFAIAISRFLPPCGSITFLNRYVRRHVKGGEHRRVKPAIRKRECVWKCCCHELYIRPAANGKHTRNKPKQQDTNKKKTNDVCTKELHTLKHTPNGSRRSRHSGRIKTENTPLLVSSSLHFYSWIVHYFIFAGYQAGAFEFAYKFGNCFCFFRQEHWARAMCARFTLESQLTKCSRSFGSIQFESSHREHDALRNAPNTFTSLNARNEKKRNFALAQKFKTTNRTLYIPSRFIGLMIYSNVQVFFISVWVQTFSFKIFIKYWMSIELDCISICERPTIPPKQHEKIRCYRSSAPRSNLIMRYNFRFMW